MPSNPFASASNHASNIALPETFKAGSNNPFGKNFELPKAFHNEFGSFGAGGFGSAPAAAKPAPIEQSNEENSPSAGISSDHRPRGKAASENRPRYAQRRSDSGIVYRQPTLFASPSKQQEEKKEKENKGVCTIVLKDGMECEVSKNIVFKIFLQ